MMNNRSANMIHKFKHFFLSLVVLLAIHIYSPMVCAQAVQGGSWQMLDLKKDRVMGISANLAFETLLGHRSALPVIVAVIDGGVDTLHKELKNILWRNAGEVANNRIDDDHNGYVDDVHGWNFLGSPKSSFQYDNYDLIRNLRSAPKGTTEAEQLQLTLEGSRKLVQQDINDTKATIAAVDSIVAGIRKSNPTVDDFKNYRYLDYAQEQQLLLIVAALKYRPDVVAYRKHLQSVLNKLMDDLNYSLNINYNPRQGKEFRQPFNGNSDVQGPWALHGSHVAGIIAGRSVGVAKNNVKLMILRTVPTGDYLDNDMAKAIRYAADNGAKVINISAGKSGVRDPDLIEAAIRYAMDKDVLIVHASGNYGQLLEQGYYPQSTYKQGGKAKAWIEVGASGPTNDSTLILKASNYGKSVVDVFAPGVNIRSCAIGNEYSEQSGTSMAAAVVSGIAAVLRSYYPGFTAEKISKIILDSCQEVGHKVEASNGIMIPFTETCVSGGIVNLYRALRLAETLDNAAR